MAHLGNSLFSTSSFADWQCTITADETIRGSRGYHLADRGPYRLVSTVVMWYLIWAVRRNTISMSTHRKNCLSSFQDKTFDNHSQDSSAAPVAIILRIEDHIDWTWLWCVVISLRRRCGNNLLQIDNAQSQQTRLSAAPMAIILRIEDHID